MLFSQLTIPEDKFQALLTYSIENLDFEKNEMIRLAFVNNHYKKSISDILYKEYIYILRESIIKIRKNFNLFVGKKYVDEDEMYHDVSLFFNAMIRCDIFLLPPILQQSQSAIYHDYFCDIVDELIILFL